MWFSENAWRKSSYSGHQGQCVEIGFAWNKSSYSATQGQCVEVGEAPGLTGVRDSKLGTDSPVLAFPSARFAGFLAAVKGGRFRR